MIVVDASVWVSALVPSDIHHQTTAPWLRGAIQSRTVFFAPVLALAEVSGAVTRRTTPVDGRRAAAGLQRVLLIRWVPIDGRLARAASRLAIDLRLRGADAIYVAIAERLNIPLVSWDNEHVTRAAGRITVYTPATAPTP